jgi:hypothetical protein
MPADMLNARFIVMAHGMPGAPIHHLRMVNVGDKIAGLGAVKRSAPVGGAKVVAGWFGVVLRSVARHGLGTQLKKRWRTDERCLFQKVNAVLFRKGSALLFQKGLIRSAEKIFTSSRINFLHGITWEG